MDDREDITEKLLLLLEIEEAKLIDEWHKEKTLNAGRLKKIKEFTQELAEMAESLEINPIKRPSEEKGGTYIDRLQADLQSKDKALRLKTVKDILDLHSKYRGYPPEQK